MGEIERLSARVQNNRLYLALVRVGLVVFGLVYGLLGAIVLRIAWGDYNVDRNASFRSVLDYVASRPFGNGLLIVAATGLFFLVIWQLIEAMFGYVHLGGLRRFNRRIASLGRALIYLAVGVLALLVALNIRGVGGGPSWSDVVAGLMSRPGGRLAVLLGGVVVISIGVGQIGRGIGRIFVDEFVGPVKTWVVALGTFGYMALGTSLSIIGGLFAWSAIVAVPQYAGTMNHAIHFLLNQPLGSWLLTVVAAGFIAFAIFCMAWSTQPLHAKKLTAPRSARPGDPPRSRCRC